MRQLLWRATLNLPQKGSDFFSGGFAYYIVDKEKKPVECRVTILYYYYDILNQVSDHKQKYKELL